LAQGRVLIGNAASLVLNCAALDSQAMVPQARRLLRLLRSQERNVASVVRISGALRVEAFVEWQALATWLALLRRVVGHLAKETGWTPFRVLVVGDAVEARFRLFLGHHTFLSIKMLRWAEKASRPTF